LKVDNAVVNLQIPFTLRRLRRPSSFPPGPRATLRAVATVADEVAAGWEPDPLEPGRSRWWDGAAWTAAVSGGGLSWTPDLPTLPPPQPVGLDEGLGAIDPIAVAFGNDARPAPPAPVAVPRTRRRLAPVAVAAAVLLVAGAAVAGAGILDTDDQRPSVLRVVPYRDAQAGFELRYPERWRVLRRERDNGIRFAIGARGAPTTETNIVSVVVGSAPAPLPQLHSLAEQLTETMRRQLPGVRLESASRARLANAPGLHFAFRDPESTPPTRIEQYVGRTTTGRPLTATVTIREPRTAPTPDELREFIASLGPS
jgi:hypothetical protein